jgi:carnitine O-acetyltransferase
MAWWIPSDRCVGGSLPSEDAKRADAWTIVPSATATQDAERFNLLSQATSHHNALTRASSVGKGFDRHLMALKYLGSGGKGEALKHPLFDDDMWALSQEWKLSTSGLSAGGRFLGTG